MSSKILLGISYYYPNISGLTLYAQRLAQGLAGRGYKVEILTSRHLKTLPTREIRNRIVIKRVWTPFILARGPIMPLYLLEAINAVRRVDIVNCHIPQFEAFFLAILAKLMGKKVILTHHCDLSSWPGLINQLAEKATYITLLVSGILADKIIVYTKDYADNSVYLSHFKKKLVYIYPPVIVEKAGNKFKTKYKDVKYKIGFAGRMAKEKGIENLLNTIPKIKKELGNNFKIILAGPTSEVIGGGSSGGLQKLFKYYENNIELVGSLNQKELAGFYSMLDVLVLPSTEKIESFGLVQVEAMMLGCPVVASNLPGVRIPVKVTGMGEITPPGDSKKLAEAVIAVLKNKKDYIKPKKIIEEIFNYQKTIGNYEEVLRKI